MKIGTGKSKGTEGLLKIAVAIALGYALVRAGEFVYSRVPPYAEGKCLQTSNTFASLQIKKNHIIEGYSDVDLYLLFVKEQVRASFVELRELSLTEVKCE